MRFLKQYKGQILLTGILFVILIAMPFSDTLERSFPASAFQYPNEVLGYVREENGSLIVPGEAGSFALYTENMYLKEGAYNVAFQIVSFSEGSSVEIYDPTVINPDNTTGKLLAAAFLSPEEDTLHLPFVIDSYVECIQIRVVCKGPLIIQNTTLRSESRLYWDPYIYAGLLLLGSVILLLLRIRYQISTPALVLLAFAALWSSLPLCCDGLFNGHDLYFHYGRLFTLSESLLDGQFPVRIHSSMYEGMGYLCPIFYPESMLYPFALLEILGLSPIGCYKLLLVCINFATAGVSCYAFSRLFRSDKIGTIAAFLYTLSLYRFINMYTRAAVGELLAAIFLPLLLLGMYELFLGNYKNWWIAAFSFTALLQTHIISTVIAVFFSIVFALCFLPRLKEFKRVLHLLLAACTTVLLNVWFLVPLLDHMQFSVHTLNDVRGLAGYSLFAIQFFDVGVANPTATAEGPHTPTPEMPYSIGIVLLIGILLYVFASLRKKTEHTKLGNFCLAFGLFSMYASSSFFPWDTIQENEFLGSLAGSIQFAFRFLPFATVFLCVVSALGIYCFFESAEQKQLLFAACTVLAVYSSGIYLSNYTSQADLYVTQETQLDLSHETDFIYLFDNNGEYFSVRKVQQQIASFETSEGVILTDCYRNGTHAGFTYTKTGNTSSAYVDVSFNNYPYYHAYDSNGVRLETGLNELLRLRVYLPDAASDTISIHFELPEIYRTFDYISLTTALVFVLCLCYNRLSLCAKRIKLRR